MKKKIEFIKETKINGDTFYFTRIDGILAEGSMSMDYDNAVKRYRVIVEKKGAMPVKEVLETTEIEVA